MSLEKKEDTRKILLFAMLAEAPILLAGFYQFWVTNNPLWIFGAAALGGVLFIIPAVLRAKRIEERNNASR